MPRSFLIKKITGLKQESNPRSATDQAHDGCEEGEAIRLEPVSNWINSPPVIIRKSDIPICSQACFTDAETSFERKSSAGVGKETGHCCNEELCQDDQGGSPNTAKEVTVKSRPDDYRPIFLGNLESYSHSIPFAQNAPDFSDTLYGGTSLRPTARKSDVAAKGCSRKRKIDGDSQGDIEYFRRTISTSPVAKTIYPPFETKEVYESVGTKGSNDPLLTEKAAGDGQSHKYPGHSWFTACTEGAPPTRASLSSRHVPCDRKCDVVSCGYEVIEPGVSTLRCRRPSSATTPAPSVASLPPLSPVSPFSPTSPIPMFLPQSNSSYSSLNFQYHGCSFPNSCCQKYPFCCAPQLPRFRTEPNTVACMLGATPDGFTFSKREKGSWTSREKVPRNYEAGAGPQDLEPGDGNPPRDFTEYRLAGARRANRQRPVKGQNDGNLAKNDENDSLMVDNRLMEETGATARLSDHSGEGSGEENDIKKGDNLVLSDGESEKQKVGKGKKFTCKFCGKVYVSLGALKMHIRTHTLPCKCHICGKAFSRPWLLQGHIRTHTGEKPYKCHMCQRAFADRSNLRAHLQTHSDVKKYSCRTCHKTFSRMSLLIKHEEAGCLVS